MESIRPRQQGRSKNPSSLITANKYQKSAGQVILRWHVDRGILPLRKPPKPEPSARKLSYFDFELTEEEINAINRLNKEDGRIEGQDPNEYEEFE